MSKRSTALTERQQFWLRHLRACGDGSVKAYAAAHELSASSLYEARSKLRREGRLAAARPARFARVERAQPGRGAGSTLCRIHLRNGAVVEVACAGEGLEALLASVAALP